MADELAIAKILATEGVAVVVQGRREREAIRVMDEIIQAGGKAAIAWYQEVLGYRLILGPLEIIPDDTHFGELAKDILGSRLQRGRFAHLATGNQVGLELFEFEDPEAGSRSGEMEYWKNGYFHICITDPNVVGLVEHIVAHGGKQRTKVWEIFPGSERYLVYVEDPWGNVIEIYSHSYELTWSYR